MQASLAATAAWLEGLGRIDALDVPEPDDATVERHRAVRTSAWGRRRSGRPAGAIDGRPLEWARGPEPPGTSPPTWWLGSRTGG